MTNIGFMNEDLGFHQMTDQENFIINILNKKKNGYYVELGAAHYSKGNNTYTLEKDYD